MQLASGTHIPDGLLAANALLSEKLHQGSATSTRTLHQSFGVVISHTSLGISRSLYDGRVRCRYTGKERDAESGLDYFGARYYASSMGRWMSPDWADKPEAVPYSQLDNPQSLNLYGYVNNNPLSKADPDGHCPFCPAIEEALQYVADSPAGEAVANQADKVVSAIGVAGVAVGGFVATHGQEIIDANASYYANGGSGNTAGAPLSLMKNGPAAAPAEGEKTPTGPKAATAPGVTAGGQATNEHGQKLGPSGKPQANNVNSNTREGAKNAGNKGSGTVEHPNPKEGDPHFHTARGDGTKVQDSTHYNYPK
jgi:RHS repeat-associated protein